MKNKSLQVTIPVVCTRGIVIFPNQDVVIEVGREKSVNAVNEAQNQYEGHVWVVCQNDIMVDNPSIDNIYKFGT
ncbi:LON peptidase substrate-binding domain-containing protein, partial [Anaerorhabdus sp.]